MTTTVLIPILCLMIVALALSSIAHSIRHNRDINKIRQLLRHHGIEGDGMSMEDAMRHASNTVPYTDEARRADKERFKRH